MQDGCHTRPAVIYSVIGAHPQKLALSNININIGGGVERCDASVVSQIAYLCTNLGSY